MPVRASRASARSTCPKCIVQRDCETHQRSATGSRAKMFPAGTRHNPKVSDRRFPPAAKRAGQERKNKTETISAGVHSCSKLHQPIADDRESNHAFRHRLKDRREKPGLFATAQACAQ